MKHGQVGRKAAPAMSSIGKRHRIVVLSTMSVGSRSIAVVEPDLN
jgi:hypothetical protein